MMEVSSWGDDPRVCTIDIEMDDGRNVRIAAVEFSGMKPVVFRVEKISEDEGKIHALMPDGRWAVPPMSLRDKLVKAGLFDFWHTNMSADLEDELGDIIGRSK